jgi:oligosaccharide repeat unit polymerase
MRANSLDPALASEAASSAGIALLTAAAAGVLALARLGVSPVATAAVAAAVVAVLAVSWRQADLFSPGVLFSILWVLCAAIGAQIVSVEQRPWNSTVWICVVGALVAFWLGSWVGHLVLGRAREPLRKLPLRVAPWPLRSVVVGGVIWWLLAAALSAYEFKTLTGGIPLLSQEWETVRMLGGEGYIGRLIHAIAYSGILLAMVLQVALLTQPRLLSWSTAPVWGLWALSLALAACWGSRHTLFIPAAALLVSIHCLRWRLGPGRLALAAVGGLLFLAAVAYMRNAAVWEERNLEWSQVLSDIGYDGWPTVLAQGHQTVAMNFEIFRRLTETFPNQIPYQLGAFSFHWLYSLLPGNQPTLAQVQNAFWNTDFYGTLTSTYMGPLYADLGIPGVLIWTFAFAIVMRWLHDSLRLRPSRVKVVWFSFMTVNLILMPYDNVMVKLSFFLDLLILWLGITALGGRRADAKAAIGG